MLKEFTCCDSTACSAAYIFYICYFRFYLIAIFIPKRVFHQSLVLAEAAVFESLLCFFTCGTHAHSAMLAYSRGRGAGEGSKINNQFGLVAFCPMERIAEYQSSFG